MGNVRDHPSMNELNQSAPMKLLDEFKDFVDKECKRCTYIKFCRGGCPYNALAVSEDKINCVDPHCTAYKTIFKEITKRATKEMLKSATMGLSLESDTEKKTKPTIMSIMLRSS